jgi:hypothetical protein
MRRNKIRKVTLEPANSYQSLQQDYDRAIEELEELVSDNTPLGGYFGLVGGDGKWNIEATETEHIGGEWRRLEWAGGSEGSLLFDGFATSFENICDEIGLATSNMYVENSRT